jgi:hypothetical protein
MVSCIVGKKGKGKTKHLLEQLRIQQGKRSGSIVYLDKSSQHIYEIDKSVRLINIMEYPLSSKEGFLGFICGIISQDHDLDAMFLDSFLTISHCEPDDCSEVISQLNAISDRYHVDFFLSISADKDALPEEIYEDISISL